MFYRNRRVLVTGGLGFIGSNLSIRLVQAGARVTIVDPSFVGCGANLHNIAPIRDRVHVIPADIGEPSQFSSELRASEVVFNLAGEISHVHSMQFPERDLQINTVAQLRFLLACAEAAPGVRVVYASTRQIYGRPDYLPVDEEHPIRPVDFNGVHKFAATMYHMMLSRRGALDAVALRLTNVYGPRMALNIPCQGFLATYFRRLLLGQPLEVFGDGAQLRDPVFVDDVVDAFLLAGSATRLRSRYLNVGGPEALPVGEIAGILSRLGESSGRLVHRSFPEARKEIDIGSYHSDCTRIRNELGWSPLVRFEEGAARTIEYYRAELPHYLDPSEPAPTCKVPEHNGVKRALRFVAVG